MPRDFSSLSKEEKKKGYKVELMKPPIPVDEYIEGRIKKLEKEIIEIKKIVNRIEKYLSTGAT